jgi:hypothetical protein
LFEAEDPDELLVNVRISHGCVPGERLRLEA